MERKWFYYFPESTFWKSCILKIFLLVTSSTILVVSIPTNLTGDTDSELTLTCGNICEYEEWFSRAHCDERGLTYVPRCTGCEGATLLELQENNIQSIPPERVAEYYHVKTMDISRNQISVLDPGTFFQLNHLKNIICSHNGLHIVQNGLFNGTEHKLSRIYLNNNNIHIIGDEAFKKLHQLIAIYLNNNHIQSLPQNVFSDVTNIKYLILSDNDLDYVEIDQFKGLTKLEHLSLDANNLKIIPKGLFTGLESLKEVLLSHNKLITIPAPHHLGLHLGLERLDLRNNHLNQSAMTISYIVNATWVVNLNDNPFLCDCFFQSIQDLFKTTPEPQASMTCTLTNGTVYSISDYLPISCSDINKESNTSTATNYTTVVPITPHKKGNDSVMTLDQYSNVSFTTLQNNKNVGQNQERQVTTVVAFCNGITTATLIVLVIFFALWLGKSIWCRVLYIRRRKRKDGNGVSPQNVPDGNSHNDGSRDENQPLTNVDI